MGMFKRFYIIFDDVSRQISQQNISAFASSAAFFLFLSLMPILMLLCTLLPFTPVTEALLAETATELLPEIFSRFVSSLIKQAYNSSAGAVSVAVLVTLWSAGNGCLALIRSFNAIYNVTEKRNYFVLRLQAIIYTVGMLIMVLISLIALVFGESILDFFLEKYPKFIVAYNYLTYLRYPVGLLILILFFALLYTYMPNKKLKFSYQIPGAVFSGVIWAIFSFGYSKYIHRFGVKTAYGSLTVVVLMMFWIYFAIYIMMIGAYLNCYFSPMYYIIFRKRPARDIKAELIESAKRKAESIAKEEDNQDEDYRFKMGQSVRPFKSSVQDSSKNGK
ncbi:MAG: YihY/virulence factor BrkB family protein [Lachnospiraceae bacterium]|nr:YihY/virulence factor BrkB family protein [Lachnospiraceae bacterium]